MKPSIFAKANDTRGEIRIYDDIGDSFFGGGISAQSFAAELAPVKNVSTLDIYINSGGGSVFDGIGIFNQLKALRAKKIVHVDGVAASIASIIAMAGDEIEMSSNAMMMIHNPMGGVMGEAADMRKTADLLDAVRDTLIDTYAAKTGQTKDQIGAWMDAETWFKADDAVANKFATRKTADKAVKAQIAPQVMAKFKNIPDEMRDQARSNSVALARMTMRANQIRQGQPSAKA